MRLRRIFFLLMLPVFLVYLNSFSGVFQFDDYNVIVHNPVVHSWPAWLADLSHGIRPALKFTYMMNWISGMGTFGFHLFNLLVHMTNVMLFYVLAQKFTRHCSDRITSAPFGKAAFWAALLFALHPVQTEAVTYISGRSSSLMSMFYLGSILAYTQGIEENKPFLHYFISSLFFLMAVLTKEIAITLPFALLLWERVCWPGKNWRTALKGQAFHWLLLIAICFIILGHPGYVNMLNVSFETRGLRENLFSQINAITYLISRFFLINRLNIDPDLPVLSSWSLRLATEAVLLSSFIITGLLSFKKRPWLAFGILWFLLHLLPTNSVVPRLDVVNERQLYLASCGIFLAFAMEGERLLGAARDKQRFSEAVIVSLAIALFITLGYFTVARNQTYRSEIALWEDVTRKSPNNARGYNNLGYAFATAGRIADAKKAYTTALSIRPDYALARANLVGISDTESLEFQRR